MDMDYLPLVLPRHTGLREHGLTQVHPQDLRGDVPAATTGCRALPATTCQRVEAPVTSLWWGSVRLSIKAMAALRARPR